MRPSTPAPNQEPMKKPHNFHSLDRFLSGEADQTEREAIEARAAEDPAFAETLTALRSSVRDDDAEGWNVDAAWARLDASTRVARPSWTRRALIAAAVSVVAIGLSVL